MVRAFYAAATTTEQISTSAEVALTISTKRSIFLAPAMAPRLPDPAWVSEGQFAYLRPGDQVQAVYETKADKDE